jgi:hypothetical protein
MVTLIYRCPATARTVQTWIADAPGTGKPPAGADGDDVYETVKCLSCGQLHLVNPATGKVLSRGRE